MDNLASITYETFEQDPVKYTLYEEAMVRAFASRPEGEKLCAYIYFLSSILAYAPFFVESYVSLVQAVAHLSHDASRHLQGLNENRRHVSSSSRKIRMRL